MTKGVGLESPVCFVCDDPKRWGDVLEGALPDPNDEPHRFKWGRDAWIVMSYLYLRRAGHAVEIATHPNREAINVMHYNDVAGRTIVDGHYIVCARVDKPPIGMVPWSIVVNDVSTRNSRDVPLHHWPQPGLVPRDPARGDRVEVAGYFGHGPELHPSFYTTRFHRGLREKDIVWRQPVEHHDLRDVDVIVAVRSGNEEWKRHKPASKLVNAWLAGIPAIVSSEPSYTELGKDRLDFLVAENANEALEALQRLKEDPALYRQMVEHGLERQSQFSVPEVSKDWIHFLTDRVSPDFRRWKRSFTSRSRLARIIKTLFYLPGHHRRRRNLTKYIEERNFDHHLRLIALLDSLDDPPEIGDSLL